MHETLEAARKIRILTRLKSLVDIYYPTQIKSWFYHMAICQFIILPFTSEQSVMSALCRGVHSEVH